MNKSVLHFVAAITVVVCGTLNTTSEFRSPLSMVDGHGVTHFNLEQVKKAWWFDVMGPEKYKERPWYVDVWAGTFCRSAHKSFFDPELDCDDKLKNKSTRKTVSLSTLWFGIDAEAEAFRGAQAFGEGTINNPALLTDNNPSLGWARITPRIDYKENGISFGAHVKWDLDKAKRWHVGHRVTLPFHVIEIEQNASCKLEETLADVRALRSMNGDRDQDPDNVDYAYRLDFLSTLVLRHLDGGIVISEPLVDYGDGSFDLQETQIGTVPVTAANPSEDDSNPSAYVIRRGDGEIPPAPFRKQPSQVVGPLAANGSGGSEDAVLFFKSSTNYKDGLGQDKDAQCDLFVVPRRKPNSDQLEGTARQIRIVVENVIKNNSLEEAESAVEFFRANGIDLCAHERIVGLGDMLTEWYVGYGPEYYYADLVLGIRWPTGKKNIDPKRVFFQSTGHNRHFEFKIGMDGGWKPYDWFAFKLDWSYHHAFERTEKKAAPFKGATVKNIGPTLHAKVRWDYFVAHVDFNFFHPHNPDLGCVFGYEIFAKRKDRVRLACPDTTCGDTGFMTDLLGQEKELDMSILEKRTNSMTHKIRGELFHRWNFCKLFAGASHIVGGRNAMQETEAHVGVGIYF